MPRQGWETNKAGGKGPAAVGESDKSQPQPGCPVHSPQPDRSPEQWPRATLLSCCRGPASHAHGSSRLPLRLAAAERSPASAWGLDRVHGARSTASGDAALPKPALCPVAGGSAWVWAALGHAGRSPVEFRQSLGPAAPGACGCERGQGGLAGRWIAAPLQFCIPFLPDKPRRIFINQSATLFNKNLLTYK